MTKLRLIVLSALGALLAFCSACSSAQADAFGDQSFTLGEHDKIIAETFGCHADCRMAGIGRRSCTVKEMGCRAVCTELPECRLDQGGSIKVCAVVRDRL